MNKTETMKIIAFLEQLYPSNRELTADTISAWHAVIGEYDYQVAWQAAKQVAGTWDGYTMPPPAAVVKQIKLLLPEDNTAIELWRVVERMIKRGTVLTEEEFQAAPEPIKRYFGGRSAIKDLALLDIENLPNERARFLNNIGKIQQQETAKKKLPPNVARLISKQNEKLRLGNG